MSKPAPGYIALRTTAATKRAIDEAAKADRRSTSQFVLIIIEDYLMREGLLQSDKSKKIRNKV